ncbi:hypothetical protein [Microbulbifer sp. JMSA008]|uniref:hypothetical protein n=1 Tax=Microbulbifer sp. JMSA008 TaxID=3243373 RepID=UPI00403904F2
MKKREILTYPLSKEQFWAEFRNFVEYFSKRGIKDCSVLFGFAWGIEYYPGNEWLPEMLSLEELETKITELEARGLGEFGNNDVFVEVVDLEFRFCNDSDIHVGFNKTNPLVEYFYSRWEELGYSPAEWLKNQSSGPGEFVRGARPNA